MDIWNDDDVNEMLRLQPTKVPPTNEADVSLYIRAAEWLFEVSRTGIRCGCCYALLHHATIFSESEEKIQFMRDLYREDARRGVYRYTGYWFGTTFSEEETKHRIIALLLAHEIAESGGL